ncbi:cytochrome P450 [Mycena amicta]|nr:cytochrome P450 [Mycena amicta]
MDCMQDKTALQPGLTSVPTPQSMLIQILLAIAPTVVAYLLLHAFRIVYRNLSSPLRQLLSGPKIPHFLTGNFKEITDNPRLPSQWRKEFGPNFLFHGLFSVSELYTADLKALNHIITRSDVYLRAEAHQEVSKRLMGESILFAVSDQHKRQRRVMNPAFGVAQVRDLTEIFVEKALEVSDEPFASSIASTSILTQLRDNWGREIAQQCDTNGAATVEVLSGLRKMTLDVIGRAGFGHEFNALDPHGKPDELSGVFTDLFHSPKSNIHAMLRLSQGMVPLLKLLPLPGGTVLHAARARMFSIGSRIINKSKASLIAEDKTLGRRDLLSLLLTANLSVGLPESQRLSDAEVIAQIPAFFIAGHETTSSGTAWALHALSRNQSAQTKLRAELLSVATDNPTMDELNALPYLEQVVRETLRVHAPVMMIQRKAMADDVLPLSKPVVDADGREHWSLPIPKGQMIHLPIWAVNTSTEIWGEDAIEFRPERWDHIPEAASAVPGVWANLFTFFAGPHNCIGFRFSLVELKSLLFTLVRAFEIDPAVPESSIGPVMVGIIQRPAVLGQKENRSGLPLILTPLHSD